MRTVNFTACRWGSIALLSGLLLVANHNRAMAANGTWIVNGGGDYNSAGNWQGGVIASGAGFTANFNTLDITGDHDVALNAPLTIGHFNFGDTNASGGSWGLSTTSLATSIITLDNNGASPTITANPMAGAFDSAFIGHNLAGTAGFTKLGVGVVELGSGTTHTLTGGIRIDAGTLRLQSLLPAQAFTLAGGGTLEAIGGTGGTANVANVGAIAAGQTATVRQSTVGTMMGFSGTGSTLNYVLGNTGLNEMWSNWAAGGNLAQINISTDATVGTGRARFDINRNPNGFNGGAFGSTVVNLDNVIVNTRTNSQGNTVLIGELRGTTTGVLRGGEAGSAARYEIGGLNTNSTYNGVVSGNGGITINKVGTGTLTLAGTFEGDATNNSLALAGQSVARQGGVIRVTAGTLALTGASSVPGGFGATLTTIDVLPAGTFNVAGTPATFSTSPLQKIQGGGTVVGNVNHAAGRIQPGDVGAATAANEGNLSAGVVPTAGTIHFNGNLDLAGGDILYDMSQNPASGNDLVQVTGTTALTSGRIVPNFLAGIPTTGTYTVLTSTGGFSGSASNLIVDFPGRGTDPSPSVVGNSLVFSPADIQPGANLVWTGANGGTWDVETTQAWTNNGSPDVFFNLDTVSFPDGAANKAVNLTAVVTPTGTITVNTSTPYTFTGTGSIVGATGLTKTGSGSLSLQTNNSFSGPANITGPADIGGFATGLGAGPLTLNNATLTSTVSVGNSSLDIPAGTTSTIQIDGAATAGSAANIPALTGDGTLNLTSTVNDRFFGTGNTAGFTGTLNVAPSGDATLLGRVRIRGGQTDLSNAVVNLTAAGMSNQQGAAADTSITVGIGELHGDSQATLVAFEGGSTPPDIVWQIGALNTNSDFAGIISDGGGANADASIANISKVGTGNLVLSNLNTYTGNTRVDAGLLSITQSYLADTSDVFVASGGKFDLNFSGNDVIDALYLNGVPQAPGVYGLGALGSTFFSGMGRLEVTTLGPPIGVTGDYNGNGTVDAADYTIWRDHLGGDAAALLNRDPNNAGVVSQADYTSWVANFGAAAGAGAGLRTIAAVPEPASLLLVAMVAGMLAIVGRQRKRA